MSDQWATIQLQRNDLKLVALPGLGGRLWDVKFQDRSLLFQNPDLAGCSFEMTTLARLPTRSPQFGFPLWGGEKTWIAPDSSWIDGAPFPALDSGAYNVISSADDHVEMTSKTCPTSSLSVTRRITLCGENAWSFEHAVTNHGPSARMTGIWSVMMIDTPAKIGVGMVDPVFHSVFGNADSLVRSHLNCVVAACSKRQEFKVGLPCPDGRTFIKFGEDGPCLLCSVETPKQGERYAHQHPFEVFNSGDYDYCEAEWHSPQANLKPGETLRFQQDFRIWADQYSANALKSAISDREFRSCMS